MKERHNVEEEIEAPAVATKREWSDADSWRGRPKRVRQLSVSTHMKS